MAENSRIQEWQIDMQAEQRSRDTLAKAGVYKVEDLQTGRADIGKLAQMMEQAGVDEELNPIFAEKVLRDSQLADGMRGEEQQIIAPQPQPAQQDDNRLAELQAQLEASQAENERFKQMYGKGENEKGDLRRRLRMLEQAVANGGARPAAPVFQNPYAGITPPDPTAPMTQADMIQFATQMGLLVRQQMEQDRQEVINNMKTFRSYDLTVNEEEDLLERYPELEALKPGQREKLMLALARPQGTPAARPPQPNARLTPRQTSPEELLRARVRNAAFVESPTAGSRQESVSPVSQSAVLSQKMKEYQKAVNTPGGSAKALEILSELGMGVVNDSDTGYPAKDVVRQ